MDGLVTRTGFFMLPAPKLIGHVTSDVGRLWYPGFPENVPGHSRGVPVVWTRMVAAAVAAAIRGGALKASMSCHRPHRGTFQRPTGPNVRVPREGALSTSDRGRVPIPGPPVIITPWWGIWDMIKLNSFIISPRITTWFYWPGIQADGSTGEPAIPKSPLHPLPLMQVPFE